ncbi:MAG TPA: hypothetical protein VK453_28625 [Micromonosporaceae bacterium]|nr:hypothetical protein [Micromonosporaceae bacterium]
MSDPTTPAQPVDPAEALPEPSDPVRITPFEERPEVAQAVDSDTTVSGLPGTPPADGGADPDSPEFKEP